jgi:hypothetical protein
MSFAILEPLRNMAAARVVDLVATHVTVPDGLSIVDVSTVTPVPQRHWITADGGKSFTDPSVLTLTQTQTMQINRLRAACKTTIEGVFASSALGAPHAYPSGMTDQANLQAARNTLAVPLLMCADINEVWALLPHTPSQIEQVNADWIAFRQTQQERLIMLTAQVNAAATPAAVQAITWN